ncbi:MAG: DNA translocase FtsK [Solirubrobacterales bacterium]|nr:DNA translocase FtsK [Solirubrobacterales bacterium]
MPSIPLMGKSPRGGSTSRKGGKRPAARKPAKKKPAPRKPAPRRELEQRHLDLIGLGLLALGLYLGFVLYAGWDGGSAGSGIEVALTWTVGAVAYALPMLLAGIGLALVVRPLITYPGAINAGALLLVAGLLLAFAAGTAGLGPDTPVRGGDYFEPDFMTAHGGVFGEALYWASATLFQSVGAHIIAVLLVISGILLLSGRPLVSLIGSGAEAGRRAKEATGELARTARGVRGAPEGAQIGDGWTTSNFPGDDDAEITVSLGEDAATDADDDGDAATSEIDFDLLGESEEGEDEDEEEISAADLNAPEHAFEDDGSEEPPSLMVDGDEAIEVARTPMGAKRGGITESEEKDYRTPSAKLLRRGNDSKDSGPDRRDMERTARALLEVLSHFKIEARLVGTVTGPHVSRYELQLAPGTKVGKIAQLKDDISYALASTDIRILAPIPGKKAVGVEVPNARRKMVRLGDIYGGRPDDASPLLSWLGKDISGQAVSMDLAKMPHVLVAGTTGSGKSGSVNAILTSMLLHASPNELRLVLVDPKQVELNHYDSVPHLLTPVVTSARVAANVLENLVSEMESRYTVMGQARGRNLEELNKIRRKAGEAPLPHILCVIDELADLMMVAPGEVEESIIRLAQKSRAVGIHLLLATQRPSTDVITGTIKVNIPARIGFSVASQIDSRVILDQGGAESLLGQGDMLFRPVGSSKLQRVQGAFVTEEEIAKVVGFWSKQGEPQFDADLLQEKAPVDVDGDGGGDFSPDEDDLLEDAIRIVVETDSASVSMIQRRLRVGYTRAGRLIDMLERRGVISGFEGSKARQVLIGPGDIARVLAGPGDGGDGPETEGAGLETVGG